MTGQQTLFGDEEQTVEATSAGGIFTAKGFDFFEVSSMLQKGIRRSDEHTALMAATELLKSNKISYVFKRLIVIACEDCETGQNLVSEITALRDFSLELYKKGDPMHEISYYNAVITLVRAKKSRLVDWAKLVYLNNWNLHEKSPHKLNVPDHAVDMHTRRGKKNGKGIMDFYKEGSKVVQPENLKSESDYKKEAYAMHKLGGYV